MWHGQNILMRDYIYWVKRKISIVAMSTWMIKTQALNFEFIRFMQNPVIRFPYQFAHSLQLVTLIL